MRMTTTHFPHSDDRGFARFTMIAAVAVLALSLPLVAQATTKVYDLTLQTDLVNAVNNCGISPPSYYNGCSGSFGFKWTDTIAAGSTINSVKLEFNVGVDCNGSGTVLATTFNGTAQPNYTSTSFCSCSQRTLISTYTPAVALYVRGGANQFLWTSTNTCFGLNANAGIGGDLARVTVDFTAGGGGASDPWVTPLPTGYTSPQAGFIVGTNIDAKTSSRATQVSVDAVQTSVNGVATTANTINGTVNTIKTTLDATKAKIDANLDATVSSRAKQVDLDAANKKLDDILTKLGNLNDAATKNAIVAALVAAGDNPAKPPQRIAEYVLPNAAGGLAELVRKIVSDAIAQAQAAGFDESSASLYLAAGDAAFAQGAWVSAYDNFRLAYKHIF